MIHLSPTKANIFNLSCDVPVFLGGVVDFLCQPRESLSVIPPIRRKISCFPIKSYLETMLLKVRILVIYS